MGGSYPTFSGMRARKTGTRSEVIGYLIWNCPKSCLGSKEHTVPSGSRERSQNALIFPTIFITVQFHIILRIPTTGEQKPSQSCNHVTLMEVEEACLLAKGNVRVRVRENGWYLGPVARLSLWLNGHVHLGFSEVTQ